MVDLPELGRQVGHMGNPKFWQPTEELGSAQCVSGVHGRGPLLQIFLLLYAMRWQTPLDRL